VTRSSAEEATSTTASAVTTQGDAKDGGRTLEGHRASLEDPSQSVHGASSSAVLWNRRRGLLERRLSHPKESDRAGLLSAPTKTCQELLIKRRGSESV